jgi:hypothetical protein
MIVQILYKLNKFDKFSLFHFVTPDGSFWKLSIFNYKHK